MNILQEILQWSQDLRPWQSDILRRLLQSQSLQKQDHQEIYSALKAEHGVDQEEAFEALPLTIDHLPSLDAKTAETKLLAMYNLKNVNRVAHDQRIEFCNDGITIVYGDNGTGKSGYARVLKKACRARDEKDDVHPNFYQPIANRGTPSARFKIRCNDEDIKVDWAANATAPPQLSAVSVFDNRCARLYLTAENEVAYLPYGLDVFERIATEVYPEIKELLRHEMMAHTVDMSAFEDLRGPTKVGKQIEELSANTDVSIVEELGTLTPEDLKRRSDLTQTFKESDPKAKIQEIELKSQRLNALKQRVNRSYSRLDDESLGKIEKLDEQATAAYEAAEIAASKIDEKGKILSGTGGSEWKILFDAARRFSEEQAYPFTTFPNTEESARCVLCQQELNEGAERLKKFDDFIREDTAEVAVKLSKQRNIEAKTVESVQIDFGLDEALSSEIEGMDHTVLKQIQDTQGALTLRKESIIAALESHDWSQVSPQLESPAGRIDKLITALNEQQQKYAELLETGKRELLAKELEELHARNRLVVRKKAIFETITKLKRLDCLKRCEKSLDSGPISRKGRELVSSAVTDELAKSLNRELEEVRLSGIQVELKERIDKGRPFHRLTLVPPMPANLDSILSEGEQRALSIASFFAELALSEHQSPIVFDDPVSSLDHVRRKAVAERIVKEALSRQVVVFTHDTTFLGVLRDEASQNQCAEKVCFLEWEGERSGCVSDGLPWGHKNVNERLDALEKKHKALEQNWSPVPNDDLKDKMRNAYSLYRETIERMVQDHVLNGVVRRFSDWVKVEERTLRPVTDFNNDECDEILKLHKTACDSIRGHDSASDANFSVKTPSEFEGDIRSLKDFYQRIKKRKRKSKEDKDS